MRNDRNIPSRSDPGLIGLRSVDPTYDEKKEVGLKYTHLGKRRSE